MLRAPVEDYSRNASFSIN